MNIAITEGLVLSPPGFGAGLGVWSRENGTSGSATWAGQTNASIVPADQDFGTCLEIVKIDDTTKLRFMGETPIIPGAYLRIRARVKAVSGNLPSVRIAGWAGTGARTNVAGVVQAGPPIALTAYGRVVEVSAIVGVGTRGGVTMPWGRTAVYGHFGLDLTGANGGAVRIESIAIEDVTSVFLRKMMDWVDVRDFGAIGDGVTDDRAAFLAADAAAAGGEILVPDGVYFLGADTALTAPLRCKGRLRMPPTARLSLIGRFDYPTYADAFGSETEGLKRALQALFGFTDHTVLDLCGRRVEITEPMVLSELCPDLRSFSNRRVISNGQVVAVPGPAWTTGVAGSRATYNPALPKVLSEVANIANIEVGSRVIGAGVGREVYVTAKNVGAGTIALSQPLHGGGGNRLYSFQRYRYLFDFAGMEKLDRLNFADLDLLCEGVASAIMLAPDGEIIQLRDCYVMRPCDRAITSIGRGCQGMLIDRCNFHSNEVGVDVQNRTTIAINVNANDTKIRENRFVRFAHFMVCAGTGHMISGNHWFQGDNQLEGVRGSGLVIASLNVQMTVTANYVDNAAIEWTNEYQPYPDFASAAPQYSFGGLTVTGNTFLCSNSVSWFAWLIVKPYGPGHFIHGLSVIGNVFKAGEGRLARVDRVDTSIADLDYTRMRNIQFEGNSFNGIDTYVSNPVSLTASEASPAPVWTLPAQGALPFNGYARNVESLVAMGPITDASGVRLGELPHVLVRQGPDQRAITLHWTRPVKGSLHVRLRMDNQD